MNFNEFNLHADLLEGIQASGYTAPTPIQQQVIPLILSGKDIIASAQTGTGKTAAFLLPVINQLLHNKAENHVSAMIVVPTRELAIQIGQHLDGLSYFTNVSSIAIYGGNDGNNFITEKQALRMGVDVVVCTPGRMIAHLNMGYVPLNGLQFLVLDEADRMLDMGFQDDIKKIISYLPKKRQTLLFSATMPDKINQLAKQILTNPTEVNIALAKPPEKIQQQAYVVFDTQKLPVIKHILKTTPFKSALIFCSSKQNVKKLNAALKSANIATAEMHSDLDQALREDVIIKFNSGRIPVLVATDILSRGIDIDTIDLVINYDVPHDGEDYVHRIGRTARAEAEGIAITLIGEKEHNRFARIESLIDKTVEKLKVPQILGDAPEYKPRTRKYGSKTPYKRTYNNKGYKKRVHNK